VTTVVIERLKTGEHGTFGILMLAGRHLFSLEPEWKGNLVGQSCVPAGVYPLHRTVYHRHGIETYEIACVPNRTRILFHVGNTEDDTEGCILLGDKAGFLSTRDGGKKLAVLKSRSAFAMFMENMDGLTEGTIEIRWVSNDAG